MILNVDFALKLSKYTSKKRFICLKYILKKLSAILHIQFDHHTLPVTPFKSFYFPPHLIPPPIQIVVY